ncbi:MAG: hypothetical protein HFF79_06495 [Oscillospiraceae bacterium]|nr:hypothetical protein [Oscillospiraceae bacterium]MCI8877539.1 hypothetical protein [Oscillospiraceae bacterium]
MTKEQIILLVILIVGITIFVLIKEHINEKKARTGEDLAKVRAVLSRLLPDSTSYTTAYAFYKWSKYQGRSKKTWYYHYAIAFRPGELFVAPIQYAGGEVSAQSRGVLLTPENVGRVEYDGAGPVIFGKDGQEICHFRVLAMYTNQDRYEPFNIAQGEESKAFDDFLKDFTQRVGG